MTPRPNAHSKLLELLQTKIVVPLIKRGILSEFRVLTATPDSFVDNAATLVVIELVVPCPWPITDADVHQWQKRLGSDVYVVLVPSPAPRRSDSWDANRARSVLARAMVLPPAPRETTPRKGPAPGPKSSWMSACVDRRDANDRPCLVPADVAARIVLSVIDVATGRRMACPAGTTLMSAAVASELCQQCLPAHLRWRTAWRLVYSPRVHGVSLATLYRTMRDEGATLLLVQDHCGFAFGGFAPEPWQPADRYFGSGESLVFRFRKCMPKPVLSLAQQAHLLESSGAVSATAAVEDAAGDAIRHSLQAFREWHPRVRAEAERAEREATAAGHVTSPTEALDEVLGSTAFSRAGPAAAPPKAAAAATGRAEASEAAVAASVAAAAARIAAAKEAASEAARELASSGRREGGPAGPSGGGVGADAGSGYDLQVFPWARSGRDPFFQFSDLECIAMGGGSAFALYLEKDLLHGMSEPCSTFGSETLSSSQNFVIGDLELWAFDDPSEVDDLK